ncbi:MAG: LCP family protein [Candidatus Moraniibacteriota bacterium]
MDYFKKFKGGSQDKIQNSGQKSDKPWLKPLLIVVGILVLIGGFFAIKTGLMFSKITNGGNILSSFSHVIPGIGQEIKGQKEGRINVLLLGMRGADDPAGGTLADTIMVMSIMPKENKVSLVSVPRDLWVKDPGRESSSKINAVHAQGEEGGKKQGLANMKEVIGQVSGLTIHYAASIDFKGFKDLVDSLGGVSIHLDNSFSEPLQFLGATGRCDLTTFTVPTGQVETKKNTDIKGRTTIRHYDICATKTPSECGGNFKLEAGDLTLTGDQALCFSRSRDTTSDFERAKRQQIILQKIEEKAVSIGTLTDFNKLNGMIDALGNNVRTDMEAWEMKALYDVYKTMTKPQVVQRVLENSEEGLLYNPPEDPSKGYILLPIGDNYDKIKNLFQNILTLPAQSDIKPKI